VTVKLPGSVTNRYDIKGNLTNDLRRALAYDDENQLISVIVTNTGVGTTTSKSEFAYDGLFRRRVRKEYKWSGGWVLTNEVRYVYDGRLVLQERDGNNLPLVTYTRGVDLSGSREGAGGIGGLLARTDHTTISPTHAYYHADGNGNITALVNTNETVVARYHYDPFGNVLAKSGPLAEANSYRFSSQENHQPSGLLLYLYRAYDPNLQRFINREPLGELMGINLYHFAFNSPVSGVDLFGLDGGSTLWDLRDDDDLADAETPPEVRAIRCQSANELKKFAKGAEAVANQLPPVQVFTAATGKDAMGNEVGTGNRLACAAAAAPAGKALGLLGKLKRLCKFRGAAPALTGQMHHGISKTICRELDKHPKLSNRYKPRDARFVTQAKDIDSHIGYQKWHRDLDNEIIDWLQNNQAADSAAFEDFLRWRYSQPDLKAVFPNGL